jgi:hypothetical protein
MENWKKLYAEHKILGNVVPFVFIFIYAFEKLTGFLAEAELTPTPYTTPSHPLGSALTYQPLSCSLLNSHPLRPREAHYSAPPLTTQTLTT